MRGIRLIRLRIGIIGEPYECGIGPLESTSYGVSYIDKDSLVMPRLRWKDNIRMDLK